MRTYETEQDARKALENDTSGEAFTIIPNIGLDGKTFYMLGTWDEYRRAVNDAAGFLYEPLNPSYSGEDPDELVKLYGYTQRFAEDVCDEIRDLLNA